MDSTPYYRRIAKERGNSTTSWAVRAVVVSALLAVWTYQHTIDQHLADMWETLRWKWWFRHESFEPMFATISFFPPLCFFYVLDGLEVSQQFRVRPQSHDMSAWKPVLWKDLVKDPTKSRVPVLFAYIIPLIAIDFFYPRRVLYHDAPGIYRLVCDLIAMLMVYDGLFWAVHRTMHSSETLYHWVHAKHHENDHATRANDAVRLTFTEEFFDVSCSIIAVNITKAHPLSRAIYDCVIVYLLVEAHCGLDMPWMAHNVVPFGLMGGPRRHDMHHASGRHYHQKFFTYLDDLFGPLHHGDAGAKRLYGPTAADKAKEETQSAKIVDATQSTMSCSNSIVIASSSGSSCSRSCCSSGSS